MNAQSLEKKKITLAVGGKTLPYYLPLTIAERKGYFKAEGLEVEIVDFPGGAKALQAMVGGSARMAQRLWIPAPDYDTRGQALARG